MFVGTRGIWNFLYFLFNFAVNQKLLQKMKFVFKMYNKISYIFIGNKRTTHCRLRLTLKSKGFPSGDENIPEFCR